MQKILPVFYFGRSCLISSSHVTTFWVKSRLGFNKFCSKWGICFWQKVDFEGNFNFKKKIELIWVKTTYLDIFPEGKKKSAKIGQNFSGSTIFGQKWAKNGVFFHKKVDFESNFNFCWKNRVDWGKDNLTRHISWRN